MLNALFAFEDRSAGEAAAKSLERADLASVRVEVHVHNASEAEPVTSGVDEFATGGFVHNFLSLFEGLFDWGGSPHDASAYARTVSRGGAVVSVSIRTDEDGEKVDRVMAGASPDQRTDWRNPAPS